MPRSRPSRAFTLVEMLVVLGIIAILAALLLPAAMNAVTRARNAAIALEINQIASAIESYKNDKGDYPPNFRNYETFIRHVRRCYPKVSTPHLNQFIALVWGPTYSLASPPPITAIPGIDEGESLVFWLSSTTTDARQPFAPNANNNKRYYDFDATRANPTAGDGDGFASYQAKYCKDTYYIYIDSRSYDNPAADATDRARFQNLDGNNTFAFAENNDNAVRPYWSDYPPAAVAPFRNNGRPVNHTTFQLICAGQDGEFGLDLTNDTDAKIFSANTAADVSNNGINFNRADNDNITNFSGGKRLGDFNK